MNFSDWWEDWVTEPLDAYDGKSHRQMWDDEEGNKEYYYRKVAELAWEACAQEFRDKIQDLVGG